MTALVDTSVLIDYLRGHEGAATVLERERAAAPLQASEITRLEVLARSLGRQWLASHHTIDGADTDLAIAATVIRTGYHLLTRNVRHFPIFPGLQAPYPYRA